MIASLYQRGSSSSTYRPFSRSATPDPSPLSFPELQEVVEIPRGPDLPPDADDVRRNLRGVELEEDAPPVPDVPRSADQVVPLVRGRRVEPEVRKRKFDPPRLRVVGGQVDPRQADARQGGGLLSGGGHLPL